MHTQRYARARDDIAIQDQLHAAKDEPNAQGHQHEEQRAARSGEHYEPPLFLDAARRRDRRRGRRRCGLWLSCTRTRCSVHNFLPNRTAQSGKRPNVPRTGTDAVAGSSAPHAGRRVAH